MWELNMIVRMNDEAQRRADAMREHEARERQANERQFAGTCPVSQFVKDLP